MDFTIVMPVFSLQIGGRIIPTLWRMQGLWATNVRIKKQNCSLDTVMKRKPLSHLIHERRTTPLMQPTIPRCNRHEADSDTTRSPAPSLTWWRNPDSLLAR